MVAPGARLVNRAGDQLLAGAGLALHENRGVETRHARDERVDLDHLVRLPHQRLAAVSRCQLLTVLEVPAGEPPGLEGAPHDDPDLVHPEGFRQIIVRARVHGLDRGLDGGERGEDHDGQIGLAHGQALQHVEAIEIGHAQIHQDHVDRLGFGQAQALLAAGGHTHAITFAAERFPQELARDPIVVGDEKRGRGAHVPKLANVVWWYPMMAISRWFTATSTDPAILALAHSLRTRGNSKPAVAASAAKARPLVPRAALTPKSDASAPIW